MQGILEILPKTAPAALRRPTSRAHSRSPDTLLAQVQTQLLELAEQRLSASPEGTLHERESLLNEAYLRISASGQHFSGAAHFFFALARSMQEIRHEEASRDQRLAIGGLRERVSQETLTNQPGPEDPGEEIMMVDEAIMKLKRNDPTNARVVVLRYFNGLTADETAGVMGISLATVERKWRRLKLWLHRELV